MNDVELAWMGMMIGRPAIGRRWHSITIESGGIAKKGTKIS